jgi:hypothetical protein
MTEPTTTLVSAFLTKINDRTDNNIDTYINNGKLLLKTKINKIIFIDELIFDKFEDLKNGNTTLIKINKNDIYLYKYVAQITHFEINSTHIEKDTIDYMCLICSKTEWVAKAIELNTYNSNNYIWVDFGIRYIFKCTDNEFIEKINRLNDYNNIQIFKIRIGNIWNLNFTFNGDIYKQVEWYFAGGIFGGNKDCLLQFAEIMKSKCVDIILTQNTLMWEVNIWYLIYLENKDLFNCYECDHNNTILDNF